MVNIKRAEIESWQVIMGESSIKLLLSGGHNNIMQIASSISSTAHNKVIYNMNMDSVVIDDDR